jgi:hypothetical protein
MEDQLVLPPTTEDIDARSERLLQEFHKHKAEFYAHMRNENPEYLNPDGSLDEHKIFEGWILQKVAGLQVLLEYYERVIRDIQRGQK